MRVTELYADMHAHTTCSDGLLSPNQLLEKAARIGLHAIAITDHDTTAAHRLLKAEGEHASVKVITGIELSCVDNGREVHILGYYVDIDNEDLKQYEVEKRTERSDRAKSMVSKLNGMHVPITYEEVADAAGTAPVGRPHIASVLVRRGIVSTIQKAFDVYLDSGKPAYAPRASFTVRQAAQLIRSAGGVSVVAHPARVFMDPRLFLSLVASGIDGIEVYHPSHWNVTREYYRMLAIQHNLLITGGSDFHGSRDYDEKNFGSFGVTEELFEATHTRVLQRRMHGH